jgi:hypothetical protein
MDELIEFIDEDDRLEFIISLDYSSYGGQQYTCSEWADLYTELGDYGNNPLILDTDPDRYIWNMFAGYSYSAYAFLDHNMVLRYKFDTPNLYSFQYTYIPNLIDSMYGCTDIDACNYDLGAVYDDGSCQFIDCNLCDDMDSQLSCMATQGCMWMGDHCMEVNDNCMDYHTQLDCMNIDGCYWMGDHCMAGSNCTDPIALNYNPIADLLDEGDNSSCQYSSFINFGCTYEGAINFDENANVDDGSCEYMAGDLNNDGGINILDISILVNWVLEIFN